MLLDEPTNHLDMESIIWLENFLKDYPGAIVLVSHDKQFMTAVCNRTFDINNNELIMEKNIDFYSMCEHHFLPFFGTICIAYVPNKKIFGFGDILKLIEILSRRPQLQERLTEEIARYIYELLDCQGVYVVIEAKHLCMTMRGQKKENTKILTTSAKGIFESDINKKMEVLTLLK